MNRRTGALYLIPLGLALAVFFLAQLLAAQGVIEGGQEFLYTGLAFVVGYVIMLAARTRMVPRGVRYAATLYSRGEFPAALAAANQAVEANPELWEAYYVRALIQLGRARHKDAEADARRAIELKPDVGASYGVLGQILFWQARFDEAFAAFEEAIAHEKRDALNYFYAGASQFELGNYAKAEPYLRAASDMKLPSPPMRLLVHYYLGASLEAQGHQEEAEEAFAEMDGMHSELESLWEDLRRAPHSPALAQLKEAAKAIEKRMPPAK